MGRSAGETVDALDFEAEGVDGEDALDYDHGHGGVVAGEEVGQAEAEDGAGGR